MSERQEEDKIQRILVALDASTDSLAALDAAAKLAQCLQAELVGLFVEDVNLLYMAGLPFTRELRFPSLGDVTHEQMEQALRLQASQARRALAQAAEPRSVRWSFRVVRGQVTSELLAAALTADLITLGKASRPLRRSSRLGSTAQALAQQAPRSILLTQQSVKEDRPLLLTYDGTAMAQKALQVAFHLAQSHQLPLTILLPATNNYDLDHLAEKAGHWLAQQSPQLTAVQFVRLPHPDVVHLIEAVNLEGGGSLVLGGPASLLEAEAIQSLLDGLDCPVLVVR